MGKPGAYLEIGRREHEQRPQAESARDFDAFALDLPAAEQRAQASRCMNCGVPFCQSGMRFEGARQATGCPLHNLIPETNDLLFRGRMSDAAGRLALTNPFPEFTGRVCPAPCEIACNLGLNDDAVTIHDNERMISDYAWERGVDPLPWAPHDAPLVSVVGAGPAGLAAAWELARLGARVHVYERDERPGGLLMYGIPNMKLPKWVVERRIALMEASGIEFICSTDAALFAEQICAESAAVVLACGAREPRRLDVPGAGLDGVVCALDYLSEATRALMERRAPLISAEGKDVAVIGGGDTGVDCVATALRQGAASVRQIVRAQRPPAEVDARSVWPAPRNEFTQGYGQREAEALFGEDPRVWGVDTVGFDGDGAGHVSSVRIEGRAAGACQVGARSVPAQLVLIAKGFLGPEQPTVDAFSGFANVHLAGDARMGATLVATAMADALEVARQVADSLQLPSAQ